MEELSELSKVEFLRIFFDSESSFFVSDCSGASEFSLHFASSLVWDLKGWKGFIQASVDIRDPLKGSDFWFY